MKSKVFLFISIILLTAFSSNSNAQTKTPEPTAYMTLEFMHVKPGGDNEYIQIENIWRKIHEQQLKAGKIYTWSVWEVIAPYNLNAKYNYVVLTVYPKFSDYLEPYKNIKIQDVFPNLSKDSIGHIFQRTDKAREMVSTSVYKVMDRNAKPKVQTEYVSFTEMKAAPGKEAAYENLEMKDWKKIHQDLINNGFEEETVFLRLLFPAESNNPYNYAIARSFKDAEMFDKMSQTDWNKYKKMYPAAFANVEGLRTEVHTEIDHRVVHLDEEN